MPHTRLSEGTRVLLTLLVTPFCLSQVEPSQPMRLPKVRSAKTAKQSEAMQHQVCAQAAWRTNPSQRQ